MNQKPNPRRSKEPMGVIVSFHAHPDDEAIATGGSLARAADDGHRVVLVWATQGENGEVAADFDKGDEELWQHRVREAARAAEILGAARHEFLGYRDSGMMGTPENDDPRSFWRADVGQAAKQLAAILREENADVLTIYDDNGGYGHPDHIQVHRVGRRAAELAGTPRVYESTISREAAVEGFKRMADEGLMPSQEDWDGIEEFGKPDAMITTEIDVSAQVDRKRAAMQAHPSQIAADSWFLSLPPDVFRQMFATEWYIREGVEPTGIRETSLFGDDGHERREP
jgi:LmbE family N-acetylglucosaminyl deacetylase